jgi:uncharacterized RDD family membrane protein YckC
MFDESHSIETPEQTNIEFTVAGVGSRALALAIDTLIQFGSMLLVLMAGIFAAAVASVSAPQGGMWFTAVLVIVVFVLYYGYFALFEIFWNGQTPGKRQLHIRVIKDTGRRLTPLETITRNLLRVVDQLPGFYAVGMVVSLLNKQNKRIGDLVTGALVVRETSVSELKPLWFSGEAQPQRSALIGANLLTDDELILIESFLQRRYELDPAIRSRMAQSILDRVRDKFSLSQNEQGGAESLLEAAAQQRRRGL